MDKIDRLILSHLQANARLSNLELAEAVGLSPTPCHRRVKRLEQTGVIKKHVTLLNREALNLKLTAMVSITLDNHSKTQFDQFAESIQKHPEIMECCIITGQTADIILKVIVEDMAHYERFLLERLTKIKGVQGVHTSFVLREIINKTDLPLF